MPTVRSKRELIRPKSPGVLVRLAVSSVTTEADYAFNDSQLVRPTKLDLRNEFPRDGEPTEHQTHGPGHVSRVGW